MRGFLHRNRFPVGQASVLTDSDIRRVFRIIETTRYWQRNRCAFVISIYAGLRVGEIAALRIGDVMTSDGEVRRELNPSRIDDCF
jgi:integrase/recombinase XerD